MKVGFFDSGLGGLTVLRETLADERFNKEVYYLGDTKNTPYGTKDSKVVMDIIEDNIKYLVEIGCNPIVIACNTATSLSIKNLREEYPEIVLIGTEPAVKVATDAHKNKKILVLATSITVKQEKLLNLIDKLDIRNSDVILKAADKLVLFAENENCLKMDKEINEYIEDLLSEYDLKEFSHIVLGCTHFPLFRGNFYDVISRVCPDANIEIIDGANGITNHLIKKMKELDNFDEKTENNDKIHIVTTSKSNAFESRTREILGDRNILFEYKLQ